AADGRRRGAAMRKTREKRRPREEPRALLFGKLHLIGVCRHCDAVDARRLCVDPRAPAREEIAKRAAMHENVLDEKPGLLARRELRLPRPLGIHVGRAREVLALEDPIKPEPLTMETP